MVTRQFLNLQDLTSKEAHLRLFHDIQIKESRATADGPIITAVINGEIMGRPMVPSRGKKISPQQHAEAHLCNHQTKFVKSGGNASAKWFTCSNCGMRWERIAIPPISGPPTEADLLLFGPHAHATYEQVYSEMRSYVDWLLMRPTEDEAFSPTVSKEQQRFIAYCTTRRSLDGHDMDLDFEEVNQEDRNYVQGSEWTQERIEQY